MLTLETHPEVKFYLMSYRLYIAHLRALEKAPYPVRPAHSLFAGLNIPSPFDHASNTCPLVLFRVGHLPLGPISVTVAFSVEGPMP